jgi:murein DD-endopeptidase MepM/ murein hydrolase activator NlpD
MIERMAGPTEAYAPALPSHARLEMATQTRLLDRSSAEEPESAPLARPLEIEATRTEPAPDEDFGPVEPSSFPRAVTGRIRNGETLAAELRSQGVSPALIDGIGRGMRPVFDFRYARAGDTFVLTRDHEGRLSSFEFQRGRRDLYRLRPGADGEFLASHEEVPVVRRVQRLGGVIHGSLFETMVALGEAPDLVHDFADIFAWDIDFSKQTRPGDEFRAVFEKFYDRDGFVRYGKVLAADYRTDQEEFVAVYFEDDDGYGAYYRPNGESVRRTFLRAPVKYTRISSRYSKSRLHPILGVRRPHEGVDYVAPIGTPVWAVADGVVVFQGWSGGFGRLVKVRHPLGYVSYYGHLSRYAEGIGKGTRVRQKQVIGYVGATGLASGAHLDYRLRVNGRFVDPLRVKLPRGEPIQVQNRDRFLSVKDVMLQELVGTSPALAMEVSP